MNRILATIALVATAALLATTALVVAVVALTATTAAARDGWVYPVGPPDGPAAVVHAFDPPAQRWLAGHRGVDLAGATGAAVRSAGAGVITYAGQLAGRGVVVVDHGSLRTTYQPVTASVAAGDVVDAGHPIGTLAAAGSHCAPASCLHWGALDGDRYLDPLSLVRAAEVRLLPLGARTVSGDPPPRPPSSTALGWPVAAPRVTSPFGMRTHPITGVFKLHDGTDFAAACGTPVRASAAGRVTHAGSRGAYGRQVTVDHALVQGAPMTTSYSHLSRAIVAAGQVVTAGQTIGLAGTTGSSTGCHLHFMVYASSSLADPMDWLPSGQAEQVNLRHVSGRRTFDVQRTLHRQQRP